MANDSGYKNDHSQTQIMATATHRTHTITAHPILLYSSLERMQSIHQYTVVLDVMDASQFYLHSGISFCNLEAQFESISLIFSCLVHAEFADIRSLVMHAAESIVTCI